MNKEYSGRKSFKLNQLGSVSRGRSRHRPRNNPALYGGPYPFFQTGDIKAAEFYLYDYAQTYSEFGLSQSKLWDPGTLCITIAANIAETAILKIKGCFPDSVVGFVADPQKADVRFIKYYIDILKLQMQSASKGTTQDNLSVDKLLTFDFLVPLVEEQRKIAAILSAYDDLIENNTRRIRILEEMAQMLYREWFVHFRFPGHEGVARVDSALGVIPAGWEVKKLGDITTKIGSGATPRGGDSSYKQTGITLIRSLNVYDYRFDDAGLAFIDDEQAAQLSNVEVQKEDILLNITGASVARCCMVPRRHLPARVNQHVTIIRVDQEQADPYFVFCTINSERYKSQLLMLAQGGATREALTKSTISNFQIVMPSQHFLREFAVIARNIFELRENLEHKNAVLRQTRELLLPRLVSGEVDVAKVEI